MSLINKKFLALLLGGFIIFLWLIKAFLFSFYLSSSLRIPITIEAVSIWPHEISFKRLFLHNPNEYKEKRAFECSKGKIKIPFASFWKSPLVIDEIELDGITLSVCCKNPFCLENNWTDLGAKMAKKRSSKTSPKGSKSVILKKIVLNKVLVKFKGAELINSIGVVNLPDEKRFDRIEIDNTLSQSGFPTEALVRYLFNQTGFDKYLQDSFAIPELPVDLEQNLKDLLMKQ
jgi:hypothetical protein